MLKQITEVLGILVLSERELVPEVDATASGTILVVVISILAFVFIAESFEEMGPIRWWSVIGTTRKVEGSFKSREIDTEDNGFLSYWRFFFINTAVVLQ